jgi:predicted ATPase
MPWEPPLLEREHETQVLEDALAQVVSTGSGRMLLVEGDDGLGKTRLLRHLRDTAVGSGRAVLSARATALERSFGFGVVRQLLESPTAGEAQSESDDHSELARLHGLYWQLADVCR